MKAAEFTTGLNFTHEHTISWTSPGQSSDEKLTTAMPIVCFLKLLTFAKVLSSRLSKSSVTLPPYWTSPNMYRTVFQETPFLISISSRWFWTNCTLAVKSAWLNSYGMFHPKGPYFRRSWMDEKNIYIYTLEYFIWGVPHFLCGMNLFNNKIAKSYLLLITLPYHVVVVVVVVVVACFCKKLINQTNEPKIWPQERRIILIRLALMTVL